MKCYFLDGIVSVEKGRSALERLLSGKGTRILEHESGDAMAYFDLVESGDEQELRYPYVSACISGRHYD